MVESHAKISGDNACSIAESVESLIGSGALAPGAQVPTVRALAETLSVSPATVSAAYRTLRERGFLISQGRSGTIVNYSPPLRCCSRTRKVPKNSFDLARGNPDPKLLPKLRPYLDKLDDRPRLYGEELNIVDLVATAKSMFAADGIETSSVAIVSGALDGLKRTLEAHTRRGDRVIVEDPCFTGIIDVIRVLGLAPIPVALDDFGMIPAALEEALRTRPAAVILTPRAQNPTGAAVNQKRAEELVRVLSKKPEIFIVEDDHAYGIAGADYFPIASHSAGSWAVIRSVSKSFGPDLRLAFVAADDLTLSRVEGRQLIAVRWVSHILQQIVLGMCRDKQVDKLLAKAEAAYGERREMLKSALARYGIKGRGRSGLNVWIPVAEETALCQGLLDQGWSVSAGEKYRLKSTPGIRVAVAEMTKERAEKFASDMAALFAPERITGAA
ncbi:MAG: aminotransferase class I/II-fold pyridoxal phosphate-dependent enzyme [Bdellovibrionales bacterium]|nr:aminotransferase class I/II-fold pyridoxal phosphate-dependent enzyme [Bdellovibrionales bacterium]